MEARKMCTACEEKPHQQVQIVWLTTSAIKSHWRAKVEKLKHEASAKEDEINQLRIKLENLLNDQAKGTKSPEKSQKQIDHLKDKINILINQLADERASSEAIQDEQDETIAQLRKELDKQKSITERIMKHLGIGKTNE